MSPMSNISYAKEIIRYTIQWLLSEQTELITVRTIGAAKISHLWASFWNNKHTIFSKKFKCVGKLHLYY